MTRKKTDTVDGKVAAPTFEQALDRLETIVSEMEAGTLSLEDMMARFEEGQGLVKLCSEKLNQVERRIEILVKEGDKVSAKPFEGGESATDKPGDEEGDGEATTSAGSLF